MRNALVLLLVLCAVAGASLAAWAAFAPAPATVVAGGDGYIDGGGSCADVC